MKKLEEDYSALKDSVLCMCSVAERMISLAVESLVTGNSEGFDKVKECERSINRMQIAIDNEAIRMMTIYGPVAMDLRFVLMVARINTELERLGDQAINMCDQINIILSELRFKRVIELPRMAEISRNMVHEAIESFHKNDAPKAKRVLNQDNQVDLLNNKISDELLDEMRHDSSMIKSSLALILVARSLERIADHATNISEEVIYLVTGEDVRHQHD